MGEGETGQIHMLFDAGTPLKNRVFGAQGPSVTRRFLYPGHKMFARHKALLPRSQSKGAQAKAEPFPRRDLGVL